MIQSFALIFIFASHFATADTCRTLTAPQLAARIQKGLDDRIRKGQLAAQMINDNPKSLADTVHTNESTGDRLAEFMGARSTSEADYMFNSGIAKTFAQGGEGKTFTSSLHPDEAMKVWYPSKTPAEFNNSVNQFIALRYLTKQNSRLGSVLKVEKVHEIGKNYIVKEFIRNAVPLRNIMSDPVVAQKIRILTNELNASSNPLTYDLRQALYRNPPSTNLMWDPNEQKILLVDTPGM